jgi:hypothetical protein
MSISAFQAALLSEQSPLFSALRKLRCTETIVLSSGGDWPKWDGAPFAAG